MYQVMMDINEFRKFGKATVDYIANYLDNIRNLQVLSDIEPGYLEKLIPSEIPKVGEHWGKLLDDIDRVIIPGLTHWHSPNFHAYYPTGNSYPAIVGELISSGLGIVCSDWFSSPAAVELELKMMDWLGQLLHLPDEFLNHHQGPGGGVIQNAASEATLIGLITGKKQKIQQIIRQTDNKLSEKQIMNKLVAYTSDQSNCSVEKAGLLASVPMRLLPTDGNGSLLGETVEKAILDDLQQDFIPCCVIATLGTTGTCSFDEIDKIGEICGKYKIWLHVDAAYAGSALVCPEYHFLLKGIDYVDSFNFNPHKWFLVNADCSAMWFRDTTYVEDTLKIIESNDSVQKIQHWQIPNYRRFRALKLWFVLRIYGVDGMQYHIRKQISMAKYFESLVKNDDRFSIRFSNMGLVCFRLNGKDELTHKLLDKINKRKNIFIMPYYFNGELLIRFVVCSRFTEKLDIDFAWKEICEQLNNTK